MPLRADPLGLEVQVLHRLVDFEGKDVLEVGCGDGRMTFRFAEHTRSVTGLDPDEALVATARKEAPAAMRSKVTFRVADMLDVELPDGAYDVVVLSRSL